MIKDPQYMAAARAKVAEIEAKARSKGLLDNDGNPVPGSAAAAAGMAAAGMGADGGGPAARAWEMENMEKHKSGLMSDAELGFANMQQAMNDPAMLKEAMNMMRNPDTMAQVQQLMKDPAFKAQAQNMIESLKGSGGFDMSKLAEQASAMGMGGMGGMGSAGGSPELERLRRENAMLKQRMGIHDEL